MRSQFPKPASVCDAFSIYQIAAEVGEAFVEEWAAQHWRRTHCAIDAACEIPLDQWAGVAFCYDDRDGEAEPWLEPNAGEVRAGAEAPAVVVKALLDQPGSATVSIEDLLFGVQAVRPRRKRSRAPEWIC